MLKQTLIAVAAVSLMAFGATDAFAGKGDGGHGGGGHHGGGGGHHGGGKHGGGGHHGGGKHGGHHGGKHHGGKHHGHYRKWSRPPAWWIPYSYPYCSYEPRKVRIKVWDRRGRPYYKWVWRDVRVC